MRDIPTSDTKPMAIPARQQIKVNLGCGVGPQPKGWVHTDYSFGLLLSKVGLGLFTKNKWDKSTRMVNLLKPLPWESGTIHAIYLSHVLEHFLRQEGEFLISECARVIAPGGIIRIVVPSIESMIKNYQNGTFGAEELLQRWLVTPKKRKGYKELLKSLRVDDMHLCMHDPSSVRRLLEKNGLVARSCSPMDSQIQNIAELETERRTGGDTVIMEGQKPPVNKKQVS